MHVCLAVAKLVVLRQMRVPIVLFHLQMSHRDVSSKPPQNSVMLNKCLATLASEMHQAVQGKNICRGQQSPDHQQYMLQR